MVNKIAHELLALYPGLLSRNYLSANLNRLVEENGEVIEHILALFSRQRKDIFNELLNRLTESVKVGIASIELMYNLALRCTVDQKHLDAFVDRSFNEGKKLEGQAKQNNLKIVCKFVCHLIKKKLFDCKNKSEVWLNHCAQNKASKYAKEFRDLLMESLK